MAQCHYHPESRASASCAHCRQQICDRCRLNGAVGRCMNCHSQAAKGGGDAAGKPKRLFCTNHDGVPVDRRCKSCNKPHCPACLNGAQHCFRCALEPRARGTGSLARRGTGKLTGATGALQAMEDMARPLPPAVRAGLAAAGALVVVVVLLVGYVKVKAALTPPPPPPPYTGVAKVAFSQPTGARPLSGNQVIKLSVAAPQHLSYVELSVDGKHWERFTRPPFQTEWPTPIVKNGRHVLEAKAVYRGGKRVALARRVCVTRNRFTAR